jgi:hypothetical protein
LTRFDHHHHRRCPASTACLGPVTLNLSNQSLTPVPFSQCCRPCVCQPYGEPRPVHCIRETRRDSLRQRGLPGKSHCASAHHLPSLARLPLHSHHLILPHFACLMVMERVNNCARCRSLPCLGLEEDSVCTRAPTSFPTRADALAFSAIGVEPAREVGRSLGHLIYDVADHEQRLLKCNELGVEAIGTYKIRDGGCSKTNVSDSYAGTHHWTLIHAYLACTAVHQRAGRVYVSACLGRPVLNLTKDCSCAECQNEFSKPCWCSFDAHSAQWLTIM